MKQKAIIGFAAIMVFLLMKSNAAGGEFRRELSTDRPDKTESPYTVEKCRFQFELQLYGLAFRNTNLSDSVREVVRTGGFNGLAKYGVSDNIDVQFLLMYTGESRWLEQNRSGGSGWSIHDSIAGQSKIPKVEFGDPQIRVKINLKGNDDEGSAFALMPYVSIPTGAEAATADKWEGGLIVPAGFAVNEKIGAGVMVEFDYLSDDDGDGHHLELVTSATTALDVSRVIGLYVELFQSVDLAGNQPWVPTFDTGITFAITGDMQLDLGINIGLNRYADDFAPFLGFSFRL